MIWLKFLPWIGGAVVIGALGLIVNGWRVDAGRLPLVEKELSDERATIAQIKADIKVLDDASAGFQAELTDLSLSAAALPDTPVRLCRATPASDVRLPAAESGSDGPPATAGVVSGGDGEDPGAGPDIGPELRALADRADRVSAQTRGLQRAADGLASN